MNLMLATIAGVVGMGIAFAPLTGLSPCPAKMVINPSGTLQGNPGGAQSIDWLPIGEVDKDLYVPITINGSAAKAYLDTGALRTSYAQSLLPGKDHPNFLNVTFPNGVSHKIPAQYNPDMNPAIPFVLSCDGLDGMVLVIDHGKRFALMTDAEWERRAFELVGYKSVVESLKTDSNKRLYLDFEIAGTQCVGELSTGTSLVCATEQFAAKGKLKPNRTEALNAYQVQGTIGFCDNVSIRLSSKLSSDKVTVAIPPESILSSSGNVNLLGLGAFQGHLVAFRFSSYKMVISPN